MAVSTPGVPGQLRAVVFAVLPGGQAAAAAGEDALAEIKELLASADVVWAADVVQHRDKPDPHSYLFPGKLGELKGAVEQYDAFDVFQNPALIFLDLALAVDGDDVAVGSEIRDLGRAEIEHRPARGIRHRPPQRLGEARP